MYKNVDAVTDLPAATWFQEIHEAFPEAKVILSVRDNEEVWVKSASKQMEIVDTAGGFVNRTVLILLAPILGMIFAPITTATQVNATLKERFFVQTVIKASFGSFNWKSTSLFKKKYREHNERVQAVIPKDKLLIYNVKQGWELLCEFLECDVPDEEFPMENVASSATQGIISKLLEEMKQRLIILLAIGALVASVFYFVFQK